MPVHVNVNGSWKNTKAVSVKVNGSWKDTYQVYVNNNGTWKPMWKYSWQTGSWGACSASCGGGTQTRTATCKRSDGYTVPDSYCTKAGIAKPSTSQSCNTQSCATYTWQTGSYGLCSSDCSTGTKTRSVYCQRNDGTKVSDSFCSGTKPSTSTSCTQNCKKNYYEDWAYVGTPITCGKNSMQRRYLIYTNNTYDGSYEPVNTDSFSVEDKDEYVCTSCQYNETAWLENRVPFVKATHYVGQSKKHSGRTSWDTASIKEEIVALYGAVSNHYKFYYRGESISYTDENGVTYTKSSSDSHAGEEWMICPWSSCCAHGTYQFDVNGNKGKSFQYYDSKNA